MIAQVNEGKVFTDFLFAPCIYVSVSELTVPSGWRLSNCRSGYLVRNEDVDNQCPMEFIECRWYNNSSFWDGNVVEANADV